MEKITKIIKINMPHDPFCHLGLETKDGLMSCDCKREERISNLVVAVKERDKELAEEIVRFVENPYDHVTNANGYHDWESALEAASNYLLKRA